jgi:hypothetical protein
MSTGVRRHVVLGADLTVVAVAPLLRLAASGRPSSTRGAGTGTGGALWGSGPHHSRLRQPPPRPSDPAS